MNNNVYFLQTIQHFGGIDILVSNAAANPSFGPILQVLAIGFYLLKYYIIIIIIHNKAITSWWCKCSCLLYVGRIEEME